MSSMTTRLKAPGSNIVARPRRAVWRTPTRESGMDPNAVGLANHAKLKVRWSSLGSGSHAWLKVCWSSLGFDSHVWPEILRSSSHVRPNVAMSDPTCLGTIHMFDLTNNRQKWQLYILVVRGEKKKKMQTINHRQQFNYFLSIHVIPCEREHNCVSSEMADDQIWPQESITRASLITWTPPTCWEWKRKLKKYLAKKQKITLLL